MIKEKNYLLTYSYENMEGMSDGDYQWYETEEQMNESIEDKKEIFKDFKICDAIEICSYRNIQFKY